MAAHKKYRQCARSTVTTEQWKLDLCRALKIEDSTIFNQGIDSVLGLVIRNGRINSTFLEKIRAEKQQQIAELQAQVDKINAALEGTAARELQSACKNSVIEQACLDYFKGKPLSRMVTAVDADGDYLEDFEDAAQAISRTVGFPVDFNTVITCCRGICKAGATA